MALDDAPTMRRLVYALIYCADMMAHDPELSSVIFLDMDEAETERNRFHMMGFGTCLLKFAFDAMTRGEYGASPLAVRFGRRVIPRRVRGRFLRCDGDGHRTAAAGRTRFRSRRLSFITTRSR